MKDKNIPKRVLVALHVFWDNAPHLSFPIFKKLSVIFPSHKVALSQVARTDDFKEKSESFFEQAKDKGLGWIKDSWLAIFLRQVPCLGVIFETFFVNISLVSFFKLLFGPKYIILHGMCKKQFNVILLCILKVFGKKFILIHWGGKPYIGRYIGFMAKFNYALFDHVFCLMSPEIEYFKPFVKGRISCLPYPVDNSERIDFKVSKSQSPRKILLGNSSHYRETYREVLNRLNPKEWEKITCMLNYGDESRKYPTDEFIKEYKLKFGEVFYPWCETVPFNEYLKILEESSFYICIHKTQTGLGAIYTSIIQGKTLILRGDNYKWIKSLGINVRNYDDIQDFSYKALDKLRFSIDDMQVSIDNYSKNFRMKNTLENWRSEIEKVLISV